MKVELSEQDIRNTVGFLGEAQLIGKQAYTLAVLIQTFQGFLQTNKDGAKPAEEIPEETPAEETTTE